MTSRNRLIIVPALLLALASIAAADPIVVWPKPSLPPGQSVYTFPVVPVQWLEYFQQRLDMKAKAGGVDLLFDGDSITDHWPSVGPKSWNEYYSDRHAFDVAIGGDGIEHALWRLGHGEVDGLDPKLIVLMIGTNNIQKYSPPQVAEGIRALVADYRKRLPKSHILLLGIFPRGHLPTDPLRSKIAQVNQSICSLDDGATVTYLDIGSKLLQPDGTIAADVMSDFLHPTEKGYEIWADAIQPIVDRYCPKSETPAAATKTPAPQFVVTWPLPEPPAGTNPLLFPVPNLEWVIHWFSGFQNNLNLTRSHSYDLIFDGDGFVANWQFQGRDVWLQHYGARNAINLAPGDQIQNIFWRVQHGELDGQNPKLIVLMVTFLNLNQVPSQIADAVKLLLREDEARCPNAHVLLLGVPPRGTAQSPNRPWIAKMNAILATFDDGSKVTFMDIGPKFLQPDGEVPSDLMPDGIRLTAKAYAVLADAIQPVVDRYVKPPPK